MGAGMTPQGRGAEGQGGGGRGPGSPVFFPCSPRSRPCSPRPCSPRLRPCSLRPCSPRPCSLRPRRRCRRTTTTRCEAGRQAGGGDPMELGAEGSGRPLGWAGSPLGVCSPRDARDSLRGAPGQVLPLPRLQFPPWSQGPRLPVSQEETSPEREGPRPGSHSRSRPIPGPGSQPLLSAPGSLSPSLCL